MDRHRNQRRLEDSQAQEGDRSANQRQEEEGSEPPRPFRALLHVCLDSLMAAPLRVEISWHKPPQLGRIPWRNECPEPSEKKGSWLCRGYFTAPFG